MISRARRSRVHVCVLCAQRVFKSDAGSSLTSLRELHRIRHHCTRKNPACAFASFAGSHWTKCRERKSRKSTSKECMRKRSCTRRRSMRQRTNAFHMPWNLLTACMCCVADARRAPNDVDRFTSCLTDANELDARDQCSFISRD